MKTIWKFPIEIRDEVEVSMPEGAHLLSVQVQNGAPCLWAVVDDQNAPEQRRFRIVGTGHPMEDYEPLKFTHVDTIQMHAGRLIFHIFEYIDISWPAEVE